MEANLEYMFKKFGFYFPDAEYLTDPEGLLKYLVRPRCVSLALVSIYASAYCCVLCALCHFVHGVACLLAPCYVSPAA